MPVRASNSVPEAGLRLTFFPSPAKDESLFSLVSRYDLLSGNVNDKTTLRSVFGDHTVIPSSGMPTHLDALLYRLPQGWPKGSRQLIENHTSFPYYRPFLPEWKVAEVFNVMLGLNGGGLNVGMGRAASRVDGSEPLRFCPECHNDDVENIGLPCWHRSHNLPGVLYCHKHAIPLRNFEIPVDKPNRHGLFLPPDNFSDSAPEKVPVGMSPEDLRGLNRLAVDSYKLLFSDFEAIPSKWLNNVYKERLHELGFLRDSGRVKLRELHDAFLERNRSLILVPPFHRILPVKNIETSWIAEMIRARRKSSHPLKHLLLIGFLFPSFEDFRMRIDSGLSPISIPIQDQFVKEPKDTTTRLRGLLSEGKSLREVALTLGKSVTTISVLADRLGLERTRARRNKINTATEKEILEQLRRGTPLLEIESIFLVSRSCLNRYLRRNPIVHEHRRKVLFQNERSRRRDNFIQFMKNNQVVDREYVRSKLPRIYIWLFRHDRIWFNAHLPSKRRGNPIRSPIVDWGARDERIASSIPHAVERILNQTGRPKRITISRLGRELTEKSHLEKSLDKLPQTRKALIDAIESLETFQLRRVAWAVKQLLEDGYEIRAWRIYRFAGLPKVVSKEVIQAILNAEQGFNNDGI